MASTYLVIFLAPRLEAVKTEGGGRLAEGRTASAWRSQEFRPRSVWLPAPLRVRAGEMLCSGLRALSLSRASPPPVSGCGESHRPSLPSVNSRLCVPEPGTGSQGLGLVLLSEQRRILGLWQPPIGRGVNLGASLVGTGKRARSCQPEDAGLAPKGLLSGAGPQARVTFFRGGCQATAVWGTCGAVKRESQRPVFLPGKREAAGRNLLCGGLGCRGRDSGGFGLEKRSQGSDSHAAGHVDSSFSSFCHVWLKNPNKSKETHPFFDWFLIEILGSQTSLVRREGLSGRSPAVTPHSVHTSPTHGGCGGRAPGCWGRASARGCCECWLLTLTAALLVENCPQPLGTALSGGDPSHLLPQPLAAGDAPSLRSSSFGSTNRRSNRLPGAVMLTPPALNIDTYLLCHSLDGLSEVITASQGSSMCPSGSEEFTCPRVGLNRKQISTLCRYRSSRDYSPGPPASSTSSGPTQHRREGQW